MANPATIERKWLLVDAANKPLGRLASQIAKLLMGKHKPIWNPSIDAGDFVVVINAEKVALTGKKALTKEYFHHTGHIGGERWISFQQYLEKRPEFPIEHAVKGMVPHTTLGGQIIKKLKIYAGPNHPHEAQNPQPVQF
jgi:large subunit ribosomal protein L13